MTWLLVGCFGFNGHLRPYFSLYQAVCQREGEREEKGQMRVKCPNNPQRNYCKCSWPLPYCNPNCRTPRHWKFTQHQRTTRPPPFDLVPRIRCVHDNCPKTLLDDNLSTENLAWWSTGWLFWVKRPFETVFQSRAVSQREGERREK